MPPPGDVAATGPLPESPRPVSLGAAARHHALLLGIVGTYAVLVAFVLHVAGLGRLWRLQWHYWFLDVLFLTWAAVLGVVSFGNRRFTATFTVERVAGAVFVWSLVPLFCDSFSSWKQALWFLVPFTRDPWLHRFDVALHGGRPPSDWLLPLLSAGVLRTLDMVYAFWFLLTMGTLVVVAWSVRSVRRQQFLLSVVLVWIGVGSALAAVFGSGGPCYYGRMVPGRDPYAALLHHLDTTNVPPLVARGLQTSLWDWMKSGTWRPFAGISAMPSVHVAMATAVAFAWASAGRVGAVCGVVFVALTLAGSVALGWHYAIDGYSGVAAAIGIWKLAGALARRSMRDRP